MHAGRACGALLFVLASIARPAGASLQNNPQGHPPLVVTDSLNRRVEIPGPVQRIISLEPEITRIIVALGGGERLVGLDFFLRYRDHLFPLLFKSGRDLPVVSNQAQDLNLELALQLRPDIVFSSPSEMASMDAVQQKIRAPVVALASIGRFENLLQEMETVGRIMGREDRARDLAAYFRTMISALSRSLEKVPAGGGPKVYLSFWGSLLRTPVFYEPVGAAGGVNCAAGLLPSYLGTAGATVPIEQIIRWNPDVILIQGNYAPRERAVTVEGVLGDPRLASVRAVRSGRVHYTFGFWYWWDPALVLVESLYLARLFYPDRFPAFDLEKEGNDVFKTFYGVEGAFNALGKVLKCHEWLRQ
jgi:iron complex transport system substrate-binding protein